MFAGKRQFANLNIFVILDSIQWALLHAVYIWLNVFFQNDMAAPWPCCYVIIHCDVGTLPHQGAQSETLWNVSIDYLHESPVFTNRLSWDYAWLRNFTLQIVKFPRSVNSEMEKMLRSIDILPLVAMIILQYVCALDKGNQRTKRQLSSWRHLGEDVVTRST